MFPKLIPGSVSVVPFPSDEGLSFRLERVFSSKDSLPSYLCYVNSGRIRSSRSPLLSL